MSYVIASAGIKGGSGKTTVAVHLAILRAQTGRDVLLVDADPQSTATDFTNLRIERCGEAGYTAIQLSGAAVRSQVNKFRDRYDDIVIDTGGRDSHSQRAAIAVADKLVIPFVPRSFDLWTLEMALAVIEEMRPANEDLKVCVFLNRADSRGSDNEEARELLAQKSKYANYTMLTPQLGTRKAFGNAAAEGCAVTELKPQDPKASLEIIELYEAIYDCPKISV